MRVLRPSSMLKPFAILLILTLGCDINATASPPSDPPTPSAVTTFAPEGSIVAEVTRTIDAELVANQGTPSRTKI